MHAGVRPEVNGREADVPGGPADALTWSDEHHPDRPGRGSLVFHGDKSPLRGAYPRTADGAPLNGASFRSGYTVETFLKLPADWDGGRTPGQGCSADEAAVARNPSTTATGLTTLGPPWLLGGYGYGGKIDQIMYGWIGDVRAVDRALPVRAFMSS